MMRLIGNLIWFVLGGLVMGVAWWLIGLVAFISILGIPWGRACFVMGNFMFWPFGREAISRRTLTGRHDLGTGAPGVVGNIIWFVLAGLWLAISHVLWGLVLCVSIIGIPFGIQHFKLAGIAVAPIGKTVVLREVAAVARRVDAELEVGRLRGIYR
jgi:uncharacterized membrane protein YccF (DUF307 family)